MIGHQKQWQYLINTARNDSLPHAFLFSGQGQLGKKRVALEFVKFLFCQAQKNRPCGNCKICQDVEKNQHPDLSLLSPEKKEIQIIQIRDLKWKMSLKPYVAPFKVAIIDDAHNMNQEAQNSLLKTLEEPKGKAVLILITEYPDQLFQTILSRAQEIKFYPVPKKEITDYLSSEGISQDEIRELGDFYLGLPGRAISFLKEPAKGAFFKRAEADLVKMTKSPLALRFQYAKELAENKEVLNEILQHWQVQLRKKLLFKLNAETKKEEFLLGGKYSVAQIKNFLESLQNARHLISSTNANQRLILECLLLDL